MRRDGFTLVEVMVSLGVMMIGGMALIGMQQQTTRANVRSRDITIATQIAQNVIERLKLEALAWNTVTSVPANDLFNAPLLRPITSATVGSFLTLPARTAAANGVTRPVSNAFDAFGADVSTTTANASELAARVRYCASYRLTWVYSNFRTMRADVRVWWTKEQPSHAIMTDFQLCADDGAALNPGGAQVNNYHIVYLSTVLRPQGAGAI